MKNIWLGMVIGAVTGAAVGAAADGARHAGQAAGSAARSVREHTPDRAALAEKVREADLPGRAHAVAEHGSTALADATRHVGHSIERFAHEHRPGHGD